MPDRSERREEIKLRLEYLKAATSVLGIALVVLAVLQWRASNINNTQGLYQHMTKEWSDHLRLFVEKPALRPYFEESVPLAPTDERRQEVLAMATLRVDAMDAILTFAQIQGVSAEIDGWRNTFAATFRRSVVLCDLLRERKAEYGLVVAVSTEACRAKR
jgi:hypothetical protein